MCSRDRELEAYRQAVGWYLLPNNDERLKADLIEEKPDQESKESHDQHRIP